LSKQIDDLDRILSDLDRLIKEKGRRPVCEKIVEYAGFLEPYDPKIDHVFELLDKHCGRAYTIKLKQTLKVRLMARGSPVSPEIIGILGTRTAYMIHEVFNPKLPLRLTRNIIDKMAEEYEVRNIKILELRGDLEQFREAIEIAEKYVTVLERLGAFEFPHFAPEYAKSFKYSGEKMSIEKAIVASMPLFYSVGSNVNVFEDTIEAIRGNFDAIYGFSIASGYALMKYMNLMQIKYFTWNVLLKLLRFSDKDALQLYQKAKNKDFGLIYDVLSKIVAFYYSGSVSKLIYAVTKGITSVESAVKILLSTSYTTSSMVNIMELLDFMLSILKTYWGKNPEVETYVFEILNKISSEARPAILRRALEMEKVREKLVEIVGNYPSTLIYCAINRLIKAYIPYEVSRKISESSKIKLNTRYIEQRMPNWKDFLDTKTIVYLGVQENG